MSTAAHIPPTPASEQITSGAPNLTVLPLVTLRPILQDPGDQVAWGEYAIAAVCADAPARSTEAAAWQAQLEAKLAAAGGLVAEGTPQPPESEATVEAGMQSIIAQPAARTP